MEHKIYLLSWNEDMKITCPECNRKVKEPYICKCGAMLRLFVKMWRSKPSN